MCVRNTYYTASCVLNSSYLSRYLIWLPNAFTRFPSSRGPASSLQGRSSLFATQQTLIRALLHYGRTDGSRAGGLAWPSNPMGFIWRASAAAGDVSLPTPERSDYPSRLHPRLVETSELLHLRSHCEAGECSGTFGRLSLVILGRGFLKLQISEVYVPHRGPLWL